MENEKLKKVHLLKSFKTPVAKKKWVQQTVYCCPFCDEELSEPHEYPLIEKAMFYCKKCNYCY